MCHYNFTVNDLNFITARVHTTTGGYVFTCVCVCSGRGVPQVISQVSGFRSFPKEGYSSPRFFLRSLVPGSLEGGTPVLARRVLQSQPRIPQSQPGEYPSNPLLGLGYPPSGQSSTASTCYKASGIPLAVRQEDFLVLFKLTQSFVQTHERRYCGDWRRIE